MQDARGLYVGVEKRRGQLPGSPLQPRPILEVRAVTDPKTEKWLRSLSAKSLARVVLYYSQDVPPSQALEACRATFWRLGIPCPRDIAALATDGQIRDREMATWKKMPVIGLLTAAQNL